MICLYILFPNVFYSITCCYLTYCKSTCFLIKDYEVHIKDFMQPMSFHFPMQTKKVYIYPYIYAKPTNNP